MKCFCVAFSAALFLATIVSAAPHPSGVAKKDIDYLIELLQCDINAVEEVSKEYGYAKKWAKFEPKYKKLVDNTNECIASINGSGEKFTECKFKIAMETYFLNLAYFGTINDEQLSEAYELSVEKCG